ncbi:MAG: adenylate/guanylate cyclase domain-containing protein [Chthoniobacterales bacterium]
MLEAPIGTITFLFTDIVGSTKLWERHPTRMGAVIAQHDALMRAIFATWNGYVFKTVGDSFCVAFETVRDAVFAARELQRILEAEDWGEIEVLKVRMGIHTGAAELRDNDYFGGTLNRVARIESAAHGGQIILSQIAMELVSDEDMDGMRFKSLGEHRLRNLERPEHLFQVLSEGLVPDFPPPRSMEVLPNNLPVQTTSFIGREQELEGIRRALEGTHLLTLTGTGGTGKTRLALEVAASMITEFRDGVWLVELAPITDASRIPEVVASTIGVREEPGLTLQETLVSFFRSKDILVILDNCEHLLPQCAIWAAEWLRNSPQLKILAASRHSLGVSGETTFPVPPLKILDVRLHDFVGDDIAERLSQYDAVKLFIARAVTVNPGFQVTNANAPAVAEICMRLDGIPLAIELAAARIRLLSPEQIADRLGDQFRLLRGGNRGGLPHQQTLQALIDWSYDLLSETERILFRRLGVFVVGRNLEAVEVICVGGGVDELDVLDLLQQLVDKSLVNVEYDAGQNPRYTLTESVWQYARQKLDASGEGDVIRNRHLDYFLELSEKYAPLLEGPNQKEYLDRVTYDRFNFRFAGEWSLKSERIEDGFRLLAALHRLVEVRGNIELIQKLMESLLAHPAGQLPTLYRARALEVAGRLSWAQDHYATARKYYIEAKELYESLKEVKLAAVTDVFLAFIDRGDEDFDTAETRFKQSLEVGEKFHMDKLRAIALSGLGGIANDRGDAKAGLQMKEESLAIYRKLGDQWIMGYILWGVARSSLAVGNVEHAVEAATEWALITQNFGNKWSIPHVAEIFAVIALAQKKFERASTLFGAAEALRTRYVTVFSPSESTEYDAIIAQLRASMEPEKLNEAWQSGRELSPAATFELAVQNDAK